MIIFIKGSFLTIKEIAVRIYLRITKGSAAELRTQAYKALKIGISLTVSRIIEKGEFILLCRLPRSPREIHDSESTAYFIRVAPADGTGVNNVP